MDNLIKRGVILFFLLIFMIFNCSGVEAHIGLSPAIIKNDFEPNSDFSVEYLILSDWTEGFEIYSEGDFAEYVTFDKNETMGGKFIAFINFPESFDEPGRRKLYIRVRQKIPGISGVGVKLEVGALISIRVPYPGKYAEISSFNVETVNEGDPVEFGVGVINYGTETLVAQTRVEVSSDGKIIDNFDLGTESISPSESKGFTKKTEGNYYKPGFYNVTAIVNYEEKTLFEYRTFRVGTKLVEITNWTSEFNESKISPFIIQIESKWNNDLKDVYAEVSVSDFGEELDSFKTPTIELKKWEKAELSGFLNTDKLKSGNYKANITVFYDGGINGKVVDIRTEIPDSFLYNLGTNTILMVVLIALGIIFLIVMTIVITSFILQRSLRELLKERGVKGK